MTEKQKGKQDFASFDLHQDLVISLKNCKFSNPTDIQQMVIPTALSQKDILASSKTGSGKTLAFCIPIIQKAISNRAEGSLVLVPTREIAIQVAEIVKDLLKGSSIKFALLIGGEIMSKQKNQLRGNPQILVGTPGRMNDYLMRKMLNLQNIKTIVLDEADRMLDMGFDVQIREIFKHVHKDCQKLMFSATIPRKIEKLANEYLNDPEIITNVVHGDISEEVKDIIQICKKATNFDEKIKILLDALNGKNGTVIIFANTKSIVEKICDILQDENFSCEFIHGELKQTARAKIIEKYRASKYQILVATDVLARGLDVDHIEHVINFDMPANFDEYTHRIGRTNRHQGAKGEILNLISQKDFQVFTEICEKLKNINSEGIDFPRSSMQNRRPQRSGFRNKDSGFGGPRREHRDGGGYGGERKSFGAGAFGGERRERDGDERRNYNPNREDRDDRRPRREEGGAFGGGSGERRSYPGGANSGGFGHKKRPEKKWDN